LADRQGISETEWVFHFEMRPARGCWGPHWPVRCNFVPGTLPLAGRPEARDWRSDALSQDPAVRRRL